MRFFLLLQLLLFPLLVSSEHLYLRDNLPKAQVGDYIVTMQNKNYSLLHIYDKSPSAIAIEEVTVPAAKMSQQPVQWKEWLRQGAPGNTCWSIYTVDLANGHIKNFYSVTRQGWFDNPQQDHFLSVLLNLRFEAIPIKNRRRTGTALVYGSYEKRPLWQPKLIFEGQTVQGIHFDAWKTVWPKDNSELAGKNIEVFLPHEQAAYPSYFPYWLQVSSLVGKATLRIIDAGRGMQSPVRLDLGKRPNFNEKAQR